MTPLAVQTLPLTVVGVLVGITLVLTWYAARRNKDTGDHYVAGRRIGGFGNGLALAGDQISAASFLGITGAIALTGFNGWWLIVGMPIAYVLVLLLVAEPLRNLGKYTLADVIATRFESPALRASIALATMIMTIIYMTVQFIGAGLIAGALLDVDFARRRADPRRADDALHGARRHGRRHLHPDLQDQPARGHGARRVRRGDQAHGLEPDRADARRDRQLRRQGRRRPTART